MTAAARRVSFFLLFGVGIWLLVALVPLMHRYLTTAVFQEQQIARTLKLEVAEDTPPGTYSFQVAWEDPREQRLLALSQPLTVTVLEEDKDDENADTDDSAREAIGTGTGGGPTGDSGAGGGEEASGDSTETDETDRTFTFQAEVNHQITGAWSGIRSDGSRRVATLAHPRARLSRAVTVPRGDYWLDVNAKHDRPGPVDMAIYLNNRAWKVIRLGLNDNAFRTHRVGRLRNFAGGKIHFRMLTDQYDRSNPGNEETDRNLHIDWWRLTTKDELAVTASARGTGTARTGLSILRHLNQIIREEVGPQFVNFDTWRYYARRLTAPNSRPEAIETEGHLRNILRFWRGVQPNLPRGN